MKLVTLAALVLAATMIAGCGNQPVKRTMPAEMIPSDEPVAPVATEPKTMPVVSKPQQEEPKKDSIAVAASAGNASGAVPAPKKQGPGEAKPVNITTQYDPNKPTLLGLSTSSTLRHVQETFGESYETYRMTDVNPPVTVHQYHGFSIGFNPGGNVVFVEVQSADINPGLGGLRLKQSTEDAVKALGKPNTNTRFVMTYRAGGVILRLDLDPKTDQIQSIKLFADE